jgi:hypothetical protein
MDGKRQKAWNKKRVRNLAENNMGQKLPWDKEDDTFYAETKKIT